MELTIGFAFLGGLASFFSPCVLSIMPVYMGYIGGYSFSNQDDPNNKKLRPIIFLHGLFFIAGFSLVFITLGITISVLGGLLIFMRWWLIRVSGLIIILFGLHLSGILRIKWLDYELKPNLSRRQLNNISGSFILGIIFAAGWTPCIGPILGSILAITINSGSTDLGFIYLFAYSIGMAVPFIITCFLIESVSVFTRKYQKIGLIMEKGMGVVLILIGILLISGIYDSIYQSFSLLGLG